MGCSGVRVFGCSGIRVFGCSGVQVFGLGLGLGLSVTPVLGVAHLLDGGLAEHGEASRRQVAHAALVVEQVEHGLLTWLALVLGLGFGLGLGLG